jgi:hypothetical protein
VQPGQYRLLESRWWRWDSRDLSRGGRGSPNGIRRGHAHLVGTGMGIFVRDRGALSEASVAEGPRRCHVCGDVGRHCGHLRSASDGRCGRERDRVDLRRGCVICSCLRECTSVSAIPPSPDDEPVARAADRDTWRQGTVNDGGDIDRSVESAAGWSGRGLDPPGDAVDASPCHDRRPVRPAGSAAQSRTQTV